ncbi:MAG: YbgA family protein [Erysipelotrichaceae bacterium]
MESVRRQLLSNPSPKFVELEKEWARYKYLVLEHDPAIYQTIRRRLNDKTEAPVAEFYQLVDTALAREENIGYAINAYQHVAGYFKEHWDAKQKAMFQSLLDFYHSGKIKREVIKEHLKAEAFIYKIPYLTDSYFFKD